MVELKKYPFIECNPANPMKQRVSKAAKLYKECSQSYMNAIRMIYSMINSNELAEEDPVKKWLAERQRNVE